MEPTLVSVKPGQSLRCDEVFGPAMAVRPAAWYDEAEQVTADLPASRWNVHHPFRGFRDSGSPFKEQDAPGLRFYTRVKTAAARFAS
jgi:alpha-ketoglutaric semialdehyde dehydrogenase